MMRGRTAFVAILLVTTSAAALIAAQRDGKPVPGPVTTVPSVDLQRYAGQWYEVARFPAWFQKKCTADVTATYSLRPDGRIDVVNRCRRADGSMDEAAGIAKKADGDTTNAKLKVRFAPAFLSFISAVWGDYWVIGLPDDYAYAVVGDPGREYLWILSRTPVLDEQKYKTAVEIAARNGFAIERLQRTENRTGNREPDLERGTHLCWMARVW